MIAIFDRPVARRRPKGGGRPARRAMVRWAWRLLVREWRQQLLIVALVVVAVGATTVGSAVPTDSPAPAPLGFGTAQDGASFQGTSAAEAREVAALEAHFSPVQVVENETLQVLGSVDSFQLRAESADGRFVGKDHPARGWDLRVPSTKSPG